MPRALPVAAELRELDVPRPGEHEVTSSDAASGEGRIELLERRLAKLARLLAERDSQLQLRIERASDLPGLASVYSEVQGLRDQSEEALRKRSLMSSIFEANRKLRERIGSKTQDAE
jgi:hypothetical protein